MMHAPPASVSASDLQPCSVTKYGALEAAPSARAHLLVGQSACADAFAAFARLGDGAPPVTLLIEGPAGAATLPARGYATFDALAAALRDTLSASRTGLRLYIGGDEAFVWRVQRIAREHGLQADEIQASVSGARRQVYCVHCSTAASYGGGDIVRCEGCGIRLAVRRHFSERLGSYMGVCADAGDPRGERR